MAEILSPEPSAVRVCDYLELAWPEVVARLSSPTIDSVLSEALRDALEEDDVTVRASPPELVVGGRARVHLWWRASPPTGIVVEGTATIVVLPVQTGRDAVTELLVEVAPAGAVTARAAGVTSRFLQVLVDRLARD